MADDSNKNKIEMTPVFRVAFPKVFEPKQQKNGSERYELVAIFPAGTDLTPLKALAKAAAEKKWGDKIPKGLRNPFKDAGERADQYEGFEEGMTFINLTSKFQPRVVNERVQPIINPKDFYAGCWARATVNAFAYDTDGNKGVSFGVNDIQKIRDDKPFAGRPDVAEVFKPVEGTAAPAASAGDDFLA